MGPKMEIKKLDDKKRCQVIFSKKRAAFKKQAKEFSLWCDVDLAYVMISPCGRVHNFSTKTSIENVMHRYVNLPVDERLSQISNAEEMRKKLEKLRQREHNEGDGNKLEHLDKQIENLEQEMQQRQKEFKYLEDDLRNYEPFLEKDRFLHQFSWSERRLKQSWERVTTRKTAFLASCFFSSTSSSDDQPISQVRTNRRSIPKIRTSQQCLTGMIDLITETGTERGMPVSHNNIGKELVTSNLAPNPSNHNHQLVMQLDPWISPYSSRVRKNILNELFGKGKEKHIAYEAPPSAAAAAARTSKFPIQSFPAMPSHQNSAEDALQALFPQPHIPMQGQKTPIGDRGAGLSSMEYQQLLGYSARTGGALVSSSNNTIQMKQFWKANQSQSITFHNQPLVASQSSLMADQFGQIAPLGVQQRPPLNNNMQDMIIGNNTSFGVDDVSLLSPPALGLQGHGGMIQMNEFNCNQEQLNSFSGGNNNLFNSLEAHPLSNLDHRTEKYQMQPPPLGFVFNNPPAPIKIDPPPAQLIRTRP